MNRETTVSLSDSNGVTGHSGLDLETMQGLPLQLFPSPARMPVALVNDCYSDFPLIS